MDIVQVNFGTGGAGDILAAFRDIDREATRVGAKMRKAFSASGSGSRGGGRVQVQEARKTAAQVLAARVAQDQALARFDAKKAAKAKKAADKEAKAAKTAADKKARALKRAQDKELRDLERKLNREIQLEERAAAKKIAAEKKLASAQKRERERSQKRWRGRAAAAGGLGLAAAGAIGGFVAGGVGAALRKSIILDDKSKRLAIQGGDEFNGTDLRRGFERTAVDVKGAKALDVAGAAEAFVTKTGDVGKAIEFQRLFAEYAVAADASADEIGGAAADMFKKFDIKTVGDMSKAMAILVEQGKKGSFELKDAAAQFPRILASARAAGLNIGTGTKAIANIGGFTQVAREATGSPEQAATAIENVFSRITGKGASIRDDYDIDVQKDSFNDVLAGLIDKVGGDDKLDKTAGLSKLFGKQGIRAIQPLLIEYNRAIADGKNGAEAVKRMLENSSEALGAEAQVRRDLVRAQQTNGAQLTHAWESLTAVVGPRLTPMVAELAGKLAGFVAGADFSSLETVIFRVVAGFGLMADWLQSNGLWDKKKLSPAEQRDDARRKLSSAERTRASLFEKNRTKQLSPDEFRQLDELNAEIVTQSKRIKGADEAMWQGPEGQNGQPKLSRQDVYEKLRETGVKGTHAAQMADAITKDATTGAAKAHQLLDGHGFGQAGAAVFGASGNEKARELIDQYGGQVRREELDTGKLRKGVNGIADELGNPAVATSIAGLVKAADEAAAAMRKVKTAKTTALAAAQ